MTITVPPALREKILQGVEAFAWAVLAAAASASVDYFLEHPALTDENLHHLWEVARAAGIAAGLLYFRTKVRLPEAHADRHYDPDGQVKR